MEKVRRDKMQVHEKVGKSRFTVFFHWFVAPEGQKVASLKRRVRSQLVRWEMKKCAPLWREAHFQVKLYKTQQHRTTFGSWAVEKMHTVCGAKHISKSKRTKHIKTHHSQTTYGSCDVKKVHAVVARSTFPSQNVQSTPCSDHFWKLRCRKSARRCGAKHISKSKCTKHTTLGPLLEVQMSKKCMPLWREARFQVKMYKAHQHRTTFGSWDVGKVHAVVERSTFPSQSDHFWKLRCRKSACRCGAKHVSKSKCKKHTNIGPLLEVEVSEKCTPLWGEARFQVKMYKAHQHRTTFGSWDVGKVHVVVARSTFPSQKCKKLKVWAFLTFRCGKSGHWVT